MTPAELRTARQIARTIAELFNRPISRAKLMIEIDRRFPGASYRSFLAGLFLFEEMRDRNGRTLQ
jgi:hypothetical protein